jgi:hypothetical protein
MLVSREEDGESSEVMIVVQRVRITLGGRGP